MISSWFRFSILVGVGIYGAVTAGFAGVIYALMGFGLFCFIMQMALGIVGGVISAVKTPRVQIDNKTMNVEVHEGGAIRGQRVNPDPTRPDTDDFMGMIEQRTHTKGN